MTSNPATPVEAIDSAAQSPQRGREVTPGQSIKLAPTVITSKLNFMITIESTDREIRVSIPRDEIDPVRLDHLLRPFRLEAAVSASALTDADADDMAEEMKREWWDENRHRLLSEPSNKTKK